MLGQSEAREAEPLIIIMIYFIFNLNKKISSQSCVLGPQGSLYKILTDGAFKAHCLVQTSPLAEKATKHLEFCYTFFFEQRVLLYIDQYVEKMYDYTRYFQTLKSK